MFYDVYSLLNLDISSFTFNDSMNTENFVKIYKPALKIKVRSETEQNYLINLGISSSNIVIAN